MPTKWYFRGTAALQSFSQALPTGKASTDTDSFGSVPADKNTAFNMGAALAGMGGGIGSRHVLTEATVSGSYTSASSPLYTLARIFVGPPLKPVTLKGAVTFRVALAITEGSASMNLFARWFIYVYRPGTGNVKTMYGPASAANESGTSETGALNTTTTAATDFSILAGDRIVVECWWDIRNTKSTAYLATYNYAGTTDPTDNSAVTDAAGYFFLNQTLERRPMMHERYYTNVQMNGKQRFHPCLWKTRAGKH